MAILDDIDFFFTNPEVELRSAKRNVQADGVGDASVLYQLRREAQGCMLTSRYPLSDKEFMEMIRTDRNCLFAFLMVTFSGFDLLAKFAQGTDTGNDHKRFTWFLERYGSISSEDAEVVYRLRCSIMHSFGLFDRRGSNTANRRIPLEETCSGECPGTGSIVFAGQSGQVVCLLHCWKTFVRSIDEYRAELLREVAAGAGSLPGNFERVFPDYGYFTF